MRKSILIIVALFIGLSSATAKSKKQKIKTASSDIHFIYMRRTACFGKCPDYSLDIKNDGTVKYSGYYFVKDSGVFEKHFSIAKVKPLFDEIAKDRLDTCKDQYENRIPDVAGIIFKIGYKGKTKEIHNAHFGPDFLKDLVPKFDEFAKVDKSWKKLPEKLKR